MYVKSSRSLPSPWMCIASPRNARSIQDLVAVLQREFGSLKIENVTRDELMPFRGTLSIEKARQRLGFAPANPIETGFPKYIKWYRQLMAMA